MPSSGSSTVDVTLSGMRFHVRIGILPHERTLAQPLEVDLTVRRSADAPVLDYRELYAIVRAVIDEEPLDYLETVAQRIASRAAALEHVRSVRVAVRKPHVMLDGPLRHAEVVLELSNV